MQNSAGARLGYDADATDAKFKGVCILRRCNGTCPMCISIHSRDLLYVCPKQRDLKPTSMCSSRTPSWRSTYVKWGRRILRRCNGTCHKCIANGRNLLYVCPHPRGTCLSSAWGPAYHPHGFFHSTQCGFSQTRGVWLFPKG